MLSKLTLRFHQKLIETLKIRGGHEKTDVNALGERFLDASLKTAGPEDSYLQLLADPHTSMQHMYRKIMLGQTFGLAPVTRDELRLLLGLAQKGYLHGRNRLVTRPALLALLEIAGELLEWQNTHDMAVDLPYLQCTYHLQGDALAAEYAGFLRQLQARPVIDQAYAERLMRPLVVGCFDLRTLPDEALAQIFTLPRLQQIFPLALRGQTWSEDHARRLADATRPVIPAVRETIEAGTLRLDIQIDGQPMTSRPGGWYDAPRLHLLITGKDFMVPYGWSHFSELLGLFTQYVLHPKALEHGHHGERVVFSPPGNASKDGFFGLDGLRIFLPTDDFETLVRELVARCNDGMLADALNSLRGLYGDL